MPTPYSVNDDDVVQPEDVNQFKKVLEGSTGYTDTFVMRSTTGSDFTVILGDTAGVNKFVIKDSANVSQATIDSDGNLDANIDLSAKTLILPKSASPSQTVEGSTVWDTDDDRLTVGTGSITKVIGLSRGAGANASATQDMVWDTTAGTFKVWDGTTSQTVQTPQGTGIRVDFRNNRRRVAEWVGTALGGNQSLGINYSSGSAIGIPISGEAWAGQDGTSAVGIHQLSQVSNVTYGLPPSKSPRMLCRVLFPAASANNTVYQMGFWATTSSATSAGAYLRVVTTGNVFFVTRQGASETATDLGLLSRTTILGFEIETADAGVTWVCRNQAGTTLATHTTNVPTAATNLFYGLSYTDVTAAVAAGVAYMYVEGTFA